MRRTGLFGTFSTDTATRTATMLSIALAGAALASWLVKFSSPRGGRPDELSEQPTNGSLRRWSRRWRRRAQPTAEAIEIAPARERALAPEG